MSERSGMSGYSASGGDGPEATRPKMTAARVSEHRLGRQSYVLSPLESPRPVLSGENVPPSTLYQSINSLSLSLSIPIFQQVVGKWNRCGIIAMI